MKRNDIITNDLETGTGQRTCPFLGLAEDDRTCFREPDVYNLCHRTGQVEPVSFTHQRDVCLTTDYENCPVFSAKEGSEFPKELRSRSQKRSWWKSRYWIWVGLVVTIVLLWIGVSFYRGLSFAQPPINTPTPTQKVSEATATPLAISTATLTPAPSRTPAVTALPTTAASPAPTAGPFLDMPFGPGNKYVIHIPQPGESLSSLADLYDTTPEVIALINSASGISGIWADFPIVILPKQRDVDGLRPLLAIQTTQRTRVADIAGQYDMLESDLRTENGLGPGEWVEPGHWLIVYGKAP